MKKGVRHFDENSANLQVEAPSSAMEFENLTTVVAAAAAGPDQFQPQIECVVHYDLSYGNAYNSH